MSFVLLALVGVCNAPTFYLTFFLTELFLGPRVASGSLVALFVGSSFLHLLFYAACCLPTLFLLRRAPARTRRRAVMGVALGYFALMCISSLVLVVNW